MITSTHTQFTHQLQRHGNHDKGARCTVNMYIVTLIIPQGCWECTGSLSPHVQGLTS